MSFDLQAIKDRLDLRELFRMDGLDPKQMGANWFASCPFHVDTSRSCKVDEKKFRCCECGAGTDAFDYWERSRNISRKDSIDQLAVVAGLAPIAHNLQTTIAPFAVRPKPGKTIHPLTASEREVWFRCAERLRTDSNEISRIAKWRGIGEDVIKWAADRGVMGLKSWLGEWREAFLVEMPESLSGAYVAVGTHIRLAPPNSWDNQAKASWDLDPSECDSWPLLIGDPSSATRLFLLEGEWDVLALIHLMRWHEEWPADTAVVGMRGVTSSLKFLAHYALNEKAVVFAIGDSVKVLPEWLNENGLITKLAGRVSRRCAFSSDRAGADLNDTIRESLTRDTLQAILNRKLDNRRLRKPGTPTFFKWCRSRVGSTDPLGKAAGFVVTDKTRPKSRSRKAWVRHWAGLSITPELRDHLAAALDSYRSESTLPSVPATSMPISMKAGPRLREWNVETPRRQDLRVTAAGLPWSG